MKKITILLLLTLNYSFGQNFFESNNQSSSEKSMGNYTNEPHNQTPSDPDQGEDGPGNPNPEVPIDMGVMALFVVGASIGVFGLIQRKKKIA